MANAAGGLTSVGAGHPIAGRAPAAGRKPASPAARPHLRPVAQAFGPAFAPIVDQALSRRKQGFESPRERQSFQVLNPGGLASVSSPCPARRNSPPLRAARAY